MRSSTVQNLNMQMSIWEVLDIPLKTSDRPSGKTQEPLSSSGQSFAPQLGGPTSA